MSGPSMQTPQPRRCPRTATKNDFDASDSLFGGDMSQLSAHQVGKIRTVAALLLPGAGDAPKAGTAEDFDDLVMRAVEAIGPERATFMRALDDIPEPVTWEVLEDLDAADAPSLEIVSAVCAAAYFMSPQALDALGYYRGPRRAADRQQIVDELETGVLDPVLDRGPLVRDVANSTGGLQ